MAEDSGQRELLMHVKDLPEDVVGIFESIANWHKWQITFQTGSQPRIHIHLHQGDVMRDKNVDASKGPTGAKALGASSKASNTGSVSSCLREADAERLSALLVKLVDQLEDITFSDPYPLEATKESLQNVAAEARSERPNTNKISSLWAGAKQWLDKVLDTGVLAIDKASTIKALVESIQKLFG